MITFERADAIVQFRVYIPTGMTWEETRKVLDMAIRQKPPELCYDFRVETKEIRFENPRHYIVTTCHPGNVEHVQKYVNELSEIFIRLCDEFRRVKEFQSILETTHNDKIITPTTAGEEVEA